MDAWCVHAFIFSVCAVLYLGRGLATSWSLAQGVLPILNRSGDWKAMRAHKGYRAIKKWLLPLICSHDNKHFIGYMYCYTFLNLLISIKRQWWHKHIQIVPQINSFHVRGNWNESNSFCHPLSGNLI
jgi:hypothetical protein